MPWTAGLKLNWSAGKGRRRDDREMAGGKSKPAAFKAKAAARARLLPTLFASRFSGLHFFDEHGYFSHCVDSVFRFPLSASAGRFPDCNKDLASADTSPH